MVIYSVEHDVHVCKNLMFTRHGQWLNNGHEIRSKTSFPSTMRQQEDGFAPCEEFKSCRVTSLIRARRIQEVAVNSSSSADHQKPHGKDGRADKRKNVRADVIYCESTGRPILFGDIGGHVDTSPSFLRSTKNGLRCNYARANDSRCK